jgi:purine-nucleoside phosphorylase
MPLSPPAWRAAVEALKPLFPVTPVGGLVLGSGLGGLAGLLGANRSVPYRELPGFPATQVAGHEGAVFALDRPAGTIALFSGRYHLYEGVARGAIGLPVQVLAGLGAGRVMLTCAAGAVDPTFSPGEVMIVTDHLNLAGWTPVEEIPFAERDPRFVDLSRCYAPYLCDGLASLARGQGVPYHRGVLACVSGPTFETPAEVRMLERLGADAVCMSTVPEVILARYLKLEVGAIAVISNRAAGFADEEIRHDRVIDVVSRAVGDQKEFFGGVADLVAAGAQNSREARA